MTGSRGRARTMWYRLAVALGLLVGVFTTGLAIRIVTYPTTLVDGEYDVGIVLGARVQDDIPTREFAARIDHAIDLYRRGIIHNIVFTGGNPPPKLSIDSEAARRYAVKRGVPDGATFTEPRSRTTLENLREAQRIVRDHGWGKVVIVSDPLHLYRASRMAAYLGLPADVSATPTTTYRTASAQLPFLLRETYLNLHFTLLRQ